MPTVQVYDVKFDTTDDGLGEFEYAVCNVINEEK